MRAGYIAFSILPFLAPDFAAASDTGFSISFSALEGGFLTQSDHFGFTHGEDAQALTLTQRGSTDHLRYALSLGYANDMEKVILDGSYVQLEYGDWVAGVGAIDRHWGPSNYTSLILSDNSRPLKSLYLSRQPAASNARWLSWLGPWYADLIVGQLEEHTNPSNPKFLGMRVGAEPIDGLVFEVVRTAEFGGDGRDNSLESFLKLLAFTNEGLEVNQLGGFSVSYQMPEHIAPLRMYLQAIGEDEAGGVPSCYFYLAGAEFKTDIAGIPSVLTLEGVDTRVAKSPNGFCGAGTAYNNFQITTGYRHFGDSMGAAIDSESVSLTLYGRHDFGDMDVSWSLGGYDINIEDINNPLTDTNEDGILATLGVTKHWGDTSLTGVLAYQSFDLNDAPEGVSFGMTLNRQF